ncbi:MAG: hypothetical protein MHMPM18_003544 [Marteilia pararefringens]
MNPIYCQIFIGETHENLRAFSAQTKSLDESLDLLGIAASCSICSWIFIKELPNNVFGSFIFLDIDFR